MPNFQQEQQLKNEGFLRRLIIKANEHSKKLTIIDTVIYIVLMVGLIAVMIIWPGIAANITDAMAYVTTAYVAVRATYGVKAGLENVSKIKQNFDAIRGISNAGQETEDETLG